jgi:hypothetical protein
VQDQTHSPRPSVWGPRCPEGMPLAVWMMAAFCGLWVPAAASARPPAWLRPRAERPTGISLVAATTPAADTEASQHREEAAIRLAWLADPATFPYMLSAHASPEGMRLTGYLPTTAAHLKAIEIARKVTNQPMIDELKVHPGLTLRFARPRPPEDACRAARGLLHRAVGARADDWKISARADGRLTVSGQAQSEDERLQASECLRPLTCCTSVVNELTLSAPNPTAPAIKPAVTRVEPVPIRPASPHAFPAELPPLPPAPATTKVSTVAPAAGMPAPVVPPRKPTRPVPASRSGGPETPLPPPDRQPVTAPAVLPPPPPVVPRSGGETIDFPPSPATAAPKRTGWRPARTITFEAATRRETVPAPQTPRPLPRITADRPSVAFLMPAPRQPVATGKCTVTSAEITVEHSPLTPGTLIITEGPGPHPSAASLQKTLAAAGGPLVREVKARDLPGGKFEVDVTLTRTAGWENSLKHLKALPILAGLSIDWNLTLTRRH